MAIALLCCSFALTAFAYTKEQQRRGLAKCESKADACKKNCEGLSGISALYNRCITDCELTFLRCLGRIGLTPDETPPPRIGGLPPNPTPTPPKGPGKISGLPESNPTATPRKKGPGKVSGLPGKSAPVSSPSGPVLLEKTGSASSTPKPTPKKHNNDHHH